MGLEPLAALSARRILRLQILHLYPSCSIASPRQSGACPQRPPEQRASETTVVQWAAEASAPASCRRCYIAAPLFLMNPRSRASPPQLSLGGNNRSSLHPAGSSPRVPLAE